MTMRAAHLEVFHVTIFDSFINAFPRYVCRLGMPHVVCSGNETNLVGAQKELCDVVTNLNHKHFKEDLRQRYCKVAV